MKTTIKYTLSQTALDREYIATGKRGSPQRLIDLDDEKLTPEQRQLIVEARHLKLFDFVSILTLAELSLYPADAILNAGRVKAEPYTFEAEPSIELVFDHIEAMLEDALQMAIDKPAIDAEIAKRKAIKDAEIQAQRERFEQERQALAEAREQARLNRATLIWDGDRYLGDLADAIYACANLERDSRFKSWIREVKSVDKTQTDGYSFVGEWVSEGTVQITDKDKRRLYLVASTTGSRRFQKTTYLVVEMVHGVLYQTTITTTNSTPGWSLRIRDQIAALLGQ